MGYLYRLPVSQVKIDKMFIRRFRYSQNNPSENNKIKKLFSSLAEMLSLLGLSTVVEGVQTKEEFDFVRSLGVDLIQGYYISKPLAADKLIELLSSDEIQERTFIQDSFIKKS